MGLGDKYVLEVPIGESETGTVWAAKEASGGRRVVIAILEEDAPDELKASFEAQAQALCSLQHPNVVRGLEAGRNEDGAPYLVMERLEGVSLAKRWASSPPLRADRTLEIGIGVVDGLAKVHEQSLASGAKLIHGDVEPGNVMLVGAPGKEVAKLIGFGLNRATTRLGSPGSRASLSTVEPFAFAAPEQARGEVDASVTADLYSAAALIFAGLTGRPPHVAESASALADAIAKQPAPAFISVRKDLAPFAATLDRALAIDPQRRYADGQALARALRTALAMGRIVGSKETPVGPRLALAVAGASSSGTLSSAGGTRASVMPPKPSESGKATQEVSGSEPAAKAPEPAAKASEPAGKAPEPAGKAPEPAGKASEPSTKASEAPAKAAEVNAQDPETDGKATTQSPAVASADGTPKLASDTNDGAPTAPSVSSDAASASDSTDAAADAGSSSGELELVSGELTIDAAPASKSQRPPPPPTMDRDSGFDVVSGVVQLEPEPAKAPSVRPPPSPTTSSARPPPPKPVHGWMPAPAPANAGAPEGAAPAALEATESAQEEALAPVLSSLELEEESAAVPALTSPDEDALARPAANGPPMWLVAALTLTVVSLGGIYAFVRLGQREPPTTTGSLGTILEDSDGQPTIVAPPVTPPAIEPAPVAAPVEPPITAPVEPPPLASPPIEPPPIEPRPVAPSVASPERVARPETPVVRPTPPRAPTGTGTAGTPPRTSPAAGTRPPGARVTPGARTTGAQSPTSMATTMTTGMSPTGGGRTTVVTDPGF